MPIFAHGFSVADLYRREGLIRLDQIFLSQLAEADPQLHQQLVQARSHPADVTRAASTDLALRIAPQLEAFIGELFGVGAELAALKGHHAELEPLFRIKREFVQRQAAKKIKPEEAARFDGDALFARLQQLLGAPFEELLFARKVGEWLVDETAHAEELRIAQQYSAWSVHTAAGRDRHHDGLLFKIPASVDPIHLIRPAQWQQEEGVSQLRIRPDHIRRRAGFGLTDGGFDLAGALDQANY